MNALPLLLLGGAGLGIFLLTQGQKKPEASPAPEPPKKKNPPDFGSTFSGPPSWGGGPTNASGYGAALEAAKKASLARDWNKPVYRSGPSNATGYGDALEAAKRASLDRDWFKLDPSQIERDASSRDVYAQGQPEQKGPILVQANGDICRAECQEYLRARASYYANGPQLGPMDANGLRKVIGAPLEPPNCHNVLIPEDDSGAPVFKYCGE
jgi:hypothetical protein